MARPSQGQAAAEALAPRRPIAALSVAIAGKRAIPEARRALLQVQLESVFGALLERLQTLKEAADELSIAARFDLGAPPRLTLVTGLADGADRLAADAFLTCEMAGPPVERVLGAILPCARAPFAAESSIEDLAGFERQAAACRFIVELDGSMEEGAPRDAAFDAQSEILLRHAGVLIAVDDADDPGRIGGTRQTIRTALHLGLPVVLMHLDKAGIAVLRARTDFDEPIFLTPSAAGAAVWRLAAELMGVHDDLRGAAAPAGPEWIHS